MIKKMGIFIAVVCSGIGLTMAGTIPAGAKTAQLVDSVISGRIIPRSKSIWSPNTEISTPPTGTITTGRPPRGHGPQGWITARLFVLPATYRDPDRP